MAFSLLQGLDLSKWLRRSLIHRQRSVLEGFGGPKWAPKELPERRKIVKKACAFTVKLAFSRFGKAIIRDERFGLKKEGPGIRRRSAGAAEIHSGSPPGGRGEVYNNLIA